MRGLITTFAIVMSIDNKEFSVTASAPSKKDKEALEKIGDKNLSLQRERLSLQEELEYLKRDYSINEAILDDAPIVQRAKGYMEQRECNNKIHALYKDIQEVNDALGLSDNSLESIHAKRFDLIVSGEDKSALKQEIVDKGISFIDVSAYIAKLIESEKEKN